MLDLIKPVSLLDTYHPYIIDNKQCFAVAFILLILVFADKNFSSIRVSYFDHCYEDLGTLCSLSLS